MTKEEIEEITTKTLEYLGGYAFTDDNRNVHLPTLMHDFLNDSRVYFDEFINVSLPSNLDEAAHEYANGENPTCPCEECLIKTFKAGAEWMAGQGVRLNAVVNNFGEVAILNYPNEDDNISRLIADNFEQGDKVVVQIRKK